MSATTSAAPAVTVINRPNAVSVGTIVWLGSEVMFFAGLFAMYFSLRAGAPDLWANDAQILSVPFALILSLIHI